MRVATTDVAVAAGAMAIAAAVAITKANAAAIAPRPARRQHSAAKIAAIGVSAIVSRNVFSNSVCSNNAW